tara:strand:+ start:3311 stop:3616 length:306 start_codon:yes stop_codon:yes gene_type:complete
MAISGSNRVRSKDSFNLLRVRLNIGLEEFVYRFPCGPFVNQRLKHALIKNVSVCLEWRLVTDFFGVTEKQPKLLKLSHEFLFHVASCVEHRAKRLAALGCR